MLRAFVEWASRGVVLKRRLPAEFGGCFGLPCIDRRSASVEIFGVQMVQICGGNEDL
jgi:hypothetical protein